MPVKPAVEVPKLQRPVFPDRCAGCGAGSPGSTYRAAATSGYWWTGVLTATGETYTVDVPACNRCGKKMRRRDRMQIASIAVIVVATVVGARWYFKDLGGFYPWLLMIGAAFVSVAQLSLWDVFSPPPIYMTNYADEVEYTFRDPDYAAEFITLNKPPAREQRASRGREGGA